MFYLSSRMIMLSGHFGYGSNRNKTPNIDRIAKDGMIFNRAFVTNSICAPSRAVHSYGKHSHLNGQLTNGQDLMAHNRLFPSFYKTKVTKLQ